MPCWPVSRACSGAVGLVAAVVSFVWALALWVVSLGPLGAILGLVWVPDLALPFVVRARLGEWPWAWIIVSVAAFVLYAAGPLMDEGEGA